jgi:tetratricopeptide (TPR) repeat protein
MLFLSFILAALSADVPSSKSFPVNKTAALISSIIIVGIVVRTAYACWAEIELKKQLSNTLKSENTEYISKWMPQTGPNLYTCAGICMKMKNRKKADIYLQKAIEITSNHNIYKALGNRAAQKREHSQAIKYYNNALNMMPLLILPRYELFKIYQKTGMKEQANEQARLILSIQPKMKNKKIDRIKDIIQKYSMSRKQTSLKTIIPRQYQKQYCKKHKPSSMKSMHC